MLRFFRSSGACPRTGEPEGRAGVTFPVFALDGRASGEAVPCVAGTRSPEFQPVAGRNSCSGGIECDAPDSRTRSAIAVRSEGNLEPVDGTAGTEDRAESRRAAGLTGEGAAGSVGFDWRAASACGRDGQQSAA